MAKLPADSRFAIMLGLAERQIIEWALENFGYNVQAAADYLGLERSGVYKRMRAFKIPTLKQQKEAEKCQDSSSTESPTTSPDS